MSNEEFNERYSHIKLTFSHYWKYTFYYSGYAPDGTLITCGWGGDSDRIYRFEVTKDQIRNVSHYDEWMSVTATKDGETVYSFYDY